MATLSLRGIRKSYGAVEVLKGVDIEVNDGEFVALVGPSGCGKSTLLAMIAGLETVTRGEIRIGGRLVNSVQPKDRDIAMVFQSYALYPTMTVRENITFGMESRNVPKAEQDAAVARVAALLQIEPLLRRKPGQLSGGQRQRVAMGRALVRDPSLFLFDEPLSNLDAKLRVDMRTEIKKLHHRIGKTTVYVTHDQVEAMTLAARIAVMHKGELQQYDEPQAIYRRPANLFVAGFMGSPAMNFIPAETVRSDAGGSAVAVPMGTETAILPLHGEDAADRPRPQGHPRRPPGASLPPPRQRRALREGRGRPPHGARRGGRADRLRDPCRHALRRARSRRPLRPRQRPAAWARPSSSASTWRTPACSTPSPNAASERPAHDLRHLPEPVRARRPDHRRRHAASAPTSCAPSPGRAPASPSSTSTRPAGAALVDELAHARAPPAVPRLRHHRRHRAARRDRRRPRRDRPDRRPGEQRRQRRRATRSTPYEPEDWDLAQNVNLRPHFFTAQAVHADMKSLGGGSIINFSSIAWRFGGDQMIAYATAKAAVVGLTRALARAFGPDNIRVNAIEPGAVMTEKQRRLWYPTEASVDDMIARQPIPRLLLGEEIARTALFLAADDSRMITKQSIAVDAGIR